LEFCLYALRNPALLPKFVETFTLFRDAAAGWLEREAQASGAVLPLPAADYAILVNALTNGFGLAKLIYGEEVVDDRYEHGVELALSPLGRARMGGEADR